MATTGSPAQNNGRYKTRSTDPTNVLLAILAVILGVALIISLMLLGPAAGTATASPTSQPPAVTATPNSAGDQSPNDPY